MDDRARPKTSGDVAGPPPVVSVVIVSYNTRAMTLDCLAALYADLGGTPAEVFVVDNDSADGSPAAVRATFPAAAVIDMGRNAGFGAANNVAMARARGEFLLLLNSDAFVKPGAVAAMVECLRRRPRAAAVGPRLLNGDGSLQRSCWRFPSPGRAWLESLWIAGLFGPDRAAGDYRRWPHDAERPVDWVIGACLTVRRAAFEQVGGFDEQFFMYAEETDWQRRMRQAGWEVVLSPDAVVTHLGGASGATDKVGTRRLFFQSQDRYLRKHHGTGGLVAARAASAVGSALRLVAWAGWLFARPRHRRRTWGKMQLAGWLLARQATDWSRP